MKKFIIRFITVTFFSIIGMLIPCFITWEFTLPEMGNWQRFSMLVCVILTFTLLKWMIEGFKQALIELREELKRNVENKQ